MQAGTSTTSAGVVGSGGAGGLQNLIRAYQAGHSWLVGLGLPSQGEHRVVLPKCALHGVLNSFDLIFLINISCSCESNCTRDVRTGTRRASILSTVHSLFIGVVLL